jgi:hypothetical protein
MPALSRATGLAAVALVAAVSAGGLIYVNSGTSAGPGGSPTPVPTLTPTVAPTPGASEVARGITAWTTYTSPIYDFTVGYPADWSLNSSATRTWHPGDDIFELAYMDIIASPGRAPVDEVGVFLWEMQAGAGEDVDSVEGLEVWARNFCTDVGELACDEFTDRAVPMCLNAGGDPCRAALLVPTAEQQYAFVQDFTDAMLVGDPVDIRVIAIGREETFPSSARYGGSVELLKSILTTLDVWEPGQTPAPPGWFTRP